MGFAAAKKEAAAAAVKRTRAPKSRPGKAGQAKAVADGRLTAALEGAAIAVRGVEARANAAAKAEHTLHSLHKKIKARDAAALQKAEDKAELMHHEQNSLAYTAHVLPQIDAGDALLLTGSINMTYLTCPWLRGRPRTPRLL